VCAIQLIYVLMFVFAVSAIIGGDSSSSGQLQKTSENVNKDLLSQALSQGLSQEAVSGPTPQRPPPMGALTKQGSLKQLLAPQPHALKANKSTSSAVSVSIAMSTGSGGTPPPAATQANTQANAHAAANSSAGSSSNTGGGGVAPLGVNVASSGSPFIHDDMVLSPSGFGVGILANINLGGSENKEDVSGIIGDKVSLASSSRHFYMRDFVMISNVSLTGNGGPAIATNDANG
jgi:hypothetical protein